MSPESPRKRFRVALSFPGERRPFVERVADVLCARLGRERVFYDKHFEAELARPNLDIYLQQIYHDDSELVAVFLCAEYAEKEWCGLEWRAIRDLIKKRKDADIMPLRFDDTAIEGLFSTDGYVDIGDRSPEAIAETILARVEPAPTTSAALPSAETWFSPQWPVTDPDIFGRGDELTLLDTAWDEGKLNIMALVAAGGVGKTALVNRWVNYRMRPDDWRGAARVFGWSFYSQGAEAGKQASADVFIDRALRWFGDEETADTALAAYDKGQRLAELVREQRTLLLLDGAEPLQEPPGVTAEHPGQLKDPGLKGLLRGLANGNPGLCVVSTRIAVADLKSYLAEGGGARSNNLDDLTPETGAAYLRYLKVDGSDAELREASAAFGNHALALTLLGRFLVKYRGGDVRKRDEIPDLFHGKGQGRHAKRVMAWYAKAFADTPEGELLHVLGLFDRPAEPGAIQTLREGAAIEGLTTRLRGLSAEDWEDVVENLRALRLVAGDTRGPGVALDCHPLVREYFGERLERDAPEAWKAAHDRLYEYYKALPEKDLPDTVEEMAPLFQAVVHGCRAGRYHEALDEIYKRRIQRGNEFYSTMKLGTINTDLATLFAFFDRSWSEPAKAWSGDAKEKALVLRNAGFLLHGVGWMENAAKAFERAFEMDRERKDWRAAGVSGGSLSQTYLAMGKVGEALRRATEHVKFADGIVGAFRDRLIIKNALQLALADTLHQAGKMKEARALYRRVPRVLAVLRVRLFLKGVLHKIKTCLGRPTDSLLTFPLVYSLPVFWYCDFLVSMGESNKAQGIARRALKSLRRWELLLASGRRKSLKPQKRPHEVALLDLSLSRALLAAARDKAEPDASILGVLNDSVDALRKAGSQHRFPLALIVRAGLYRVRGDFAHARQDLEEAWEIAQRGGMRLFECDAHIECARVLLAMAAAGEALDPSTLSPDSPFALYLDPPDGDTTKRKTGTDASERSETCLSLFFRTARGHLHAAQQLINETGYHRRDPEVQELTTRLNSEVAQ